MTGRLFRKGPRSIGLLLGLSALIAINSFGAPASAHPPGDAIISNGVVQLGIHPQAHLNVPGPPSSGGGLSSGVPVVGLRFVPTNAEATADGCLCEGWGVADATTGLTGYANQAVDGVVNITPVSFVTTASTAISVVTVNGAGGQSLQVTHDYHPAPATANLYEVAVSVKNTGTVPMGDLRYRRVMDWDVEPTPFNEFVTIQGGGATNLLFDNNNGFTTANPLSTTTFTAPSGPTVTGNFTDVGPYDHGARFDFGFGALAVGATRTFKTFYGAAGTESTAVTAITAAAVEVYSFGQPNGGAATGAPNTFIFGFGQVGGTPVGVCAELAPGTGDIVGTSGDDQIAGTPGPDRIFGLGGNDSITGLGGDDVIYGGAGSDRLYGGDGNDTLCGGADRDFLSGGAGNDKLFGGDGNDDLAGGDGDDALAGEEGNDNLIGGPGTNVNDGGNGTDSCNTPAGTNCSP
ncbi:MAG TPA: hypothetical protein VM121_04815 [Acidimicrobiales bacterium]|nr:hypothetical protein [Acidimicrobiales bacterium]